VKRRPLEIWVTGGGTREPIDAVRWIGNVSTGRMASELARVAASRGHRVTLFLAAQAPAPRSRSIDVVRFVTTAELAAALRSRRKRPDAIAHAAAVSDYAPRARRGKVKSGAARWTLELRPLPKLAPRLRRRHREAVLALFKLEAGIARRELFARAARAAIAAGADVVFANLLEEVGADHRGWLVDPAGGVPREASTRRGAARMIVRELELRAGSR
jgi:phosphopantothenoylcysteine decarboxylase/phosphopantothenate--cysteine ligase